MKSRIQIINLLFICFLLFVLYKGTSLQLFPSQRIIKTQKQAFEKIVKIKPRRGVIYDRYGRELALSVSSFSLFADPSLITDHKSVAKKITSILNLSLSDVKRKIKNKKQRFVWLFRHLEEEHRQELKKLNIRGLGFIEEPKRIYPNGKLMSQVLGFTGVDGYGLEGVEHFYDSLLRGSKKSILTPRDARGRPLQFSGFSFDQTKGSDIYLTIDSDLQFVLEEELSGAVKKHRAKSAMGLILDAQSSEVLAMAHWPNFDPNEPFKYNQKLYRNRMTSDSFEPGSTFKTFIAGVALQEGFSPNKKYDGNKGSLKIGKHTIHEAEEDHKYKKITLSEILAVSSNVGSAKLALDLSDNIVYNSLKRFGFGDKVGVDFASEARGILRSPPWKDIETATIGFGQGVSVTAIQMAAAFTSIANGGVLKIPILLLSSLAKGGRKQKIKQSKTLHRVLTKQQAKILTIMLNTATSNKGTGSPARIKGFFTAGKTGTAQKPNFKKGGYLSGKYISSFIGFIPADEPKFVMYIIVDEPEKYFYGSQVAAPVFAAVGSYALTKKALPPSFIAAMNIIKTESKLPSKTPSKKKNLLKKKKRNKNVVPDFTGLSLRRAVQKAKQYNIKLNIRGSGRVKNTIPFSGTALPSDRKVLLILND